MSTTIAIRLTINREHGPETVACGFDPYERPGKVVDELVDLMGDRRVAGDQVPMGAALEVIGVGLLYHGTDDERVVARHIERVRGPLSEGLYAVMEDVVSEVLDQAGAALRALVAGTDIPAVPDIPDTTINPRVDHGNRFFLGGPDASA